MLSAARRLFAAQGYDAVSIRAIAAEAGVTAGLVMSYFGTKDALFREVVGGGAGIGSEVTGQAVGERSRSRRLSPTATWNAGTSCPPTIPGPP